MVAYTSVDQVFSDGPLTPLFEEFPAGVRLNDCEDRRQRQALWRSPGFRRRFRREWTGGWRKTFHRDPRRIARVSFKRNFSELLRTFRDGRSR